MVVKDQVLQGMSGKHAMDGVVMYRFIDVSSYNDLVACSNPFFELLFKVFKECFLRGPVIILVL